MNKVLLATKITCQTCLGVHGDKFPLDHGNCFSLRTEEGDFKIINFVLENLEHALQEGKISWPIKIKTLSSEHHAVVHDERFPDSWYQPRFCEVCCPKYLLPMPQLLTYERQVVRGQRVEGPGFVTILPSLAPKW